MKPSHFLLTVDLFGAHLHAYLIAPDERTVDRAINKLFDVAKQYGNGSPLQDIVLMTRLDDGSADEAVDIARVQRIVGRVSPEAADLLTKVEDFHLTIWGMLPADPDDAWLMDLH